MSDFDYSRAKVALRLVEEAYPVMKVVASGGSLFANEWLARARAMGVEDVPVPTKAPLPDDGA